MAQAIGKFNKLFSAHMFQLIAFSDSLAFLTDGMGQKNKEQIEVKRPMNER